MTVLNVVTYPVKWSFSYCSSASGEEREGSILLPPPGQFSNTRKYFNGDILMIG